MQNTKLTIAARKSGRTWAIFLPRFARPTPTPLATSLNLFKRQGWTSPIVMPTASKTAVTVKLYFLKMAFTFPWSRSSSKSCPVSLSFKISLFFIQFHKFFLACSLSEKVLHVFPLFLVSSCCCNSLSISCSLLCFASSCC